MLLADAAQVSDGKLYILGGGWSVSSGVTPMAIAMKIEVPWDQTNRGHAWMLELVTEDGTAAAPASPEGAPPIRVTGQFEVGRPPGLRPGTPLDVPVAVNVGAFALAPGRYVWRLTVDGETNGNWQLAFTKRE